MSLTALRSALCVFTVISAVALACKAQDPKAEAAGGTTNKPPPTTSAAGAAAPTAPSAARAPSAPPNAATAPLTVDDVDRYQKGLDAEIEAVRAATQKLRVAKTKEDTEKALFDALDIHTDSAGARAAGVDVNRYHRMNDELGRAVNALVPAFPLDTSKVPESLRAQIRQSDEQNVTASLQALPPAVAAAVLAHAASLGASRSALFRERASVAGHVR